MEEKREKLRKWIKEARNIVFFGGAGVSTESGIPDFRSQDGLYRQSYAYPPEQIISHSFFEANPEEFYRFYREKMLFPEAKPNRAHLALAKLEEEGQLSHRILTDFTREQGAKRYMSFTAQSGEITAFSAGNPILSISFSPEAEYRDAAAAAS